ncbi:sensor histidine kinase [Pareuzebyella sediminis]|uniref:sensor histidine kinase n=1 Tax=Pareuzebyella sediminis TaxID=2607998 RepID=UPI0011EF8068|nr:ATP-binding protein [Pareuzebyella sediminis]
MCKKYLNVFLLLYLPLLLLSLFLFYNERTERIAYLTRIEEQSALSKSNFLKSVFYYFINNANYWSSLTFPQDFDKHDLLFLRPYLEVINGMSVYDQFRIIDLKGTEVLRYQRQEDGRMEFFPLQNKSHRDYVRQGLGLEKGDILLTRINLNQENNTIERPYKPVIRTVVPIFDSLDRKKGLVVLNYNMREIFESLKQPISEGEIYLIDSNLQINSSSVSEFDMAFEVPGFRDSIIKRVRLDGFGLAVDHDTSYVKNGALWTLKSIDFNAEDRSLKSFSGKSVNVIKNTDWAIVQKVSPERLNAYLWPLYKNSIVFNFFLIVVLAGVSYTYITYQRQKRHFFRELKTNNKVLSTHKKELESVNREFKQTNHRLRLRNKQLKEFNHLVSHNLRAPVTSMSVIVDMIKSEKEHYKIQELVPKLDQISNSITMLTEDISEYVTILDSDKVDLQKINIYEKIESVRKEFSETLFQDSDFKIIYKLDAWKTVVFSKFYLRSIFENLISNAIKYRRKGVTSHIIFESAFEDGKKVLYVRDNGMGIDLLRHGDNLFKLYKRFHRDISGKGMGLFLVKSQLESLDATISVESQPNIGTTFKIEF